MNQNSVNVKIEFNEVWQAKKFYFDAVGGVLSSGCKSFHCVEGSKVKAKQLVSKAQKARGAKSIKIEWYSVTKN